MPPINGNGIRNPKRARLGIVCITLAMPSTGLRSASLRVSRIPVGIPIATARKVQKLICSLLSDLPRRHEVEEFRYKRARVLRLSQESSLVFLRGPADRHA